MAKDTLYDALTFLIFLISFFGFNESKGILKVYNWLVRVVAVPLFVSFITLLVIRFRFVSLHIDGMKGMEGEMQYYWLFAKLYVGANISCFLLRNFQKKKFNVLLKILKRYGPSRKLSKQIRRWNILLVCLVLPAYIIFWEALSPIKREPSHVLALARHCGANAILILLLNCLSLCSLPVLFSAHYVTRTLNEGVEEIRKCKSSVRRARLTTRLFLLSTRFNPLVKATNDYGAPLMFMLKVTANMISVILICEALRTLTNETNLETEITDSITYVPAFSFFLIYLWYMRVAPSANQIPSLMARVMVENVMRDERGMSREPISRFQLLTTRVVQLAHLTHSNFNQGQLTVLGEAVDEADIFMVFVEIIDNLNSINSVF